MPPHTVLFDLDSTLCLSTQDDEDIHSEAFSRAGIEPFCGVDTIRKVGPKVGDADSDHEYFRRLFERAAEHVGTDPVDADALASATLAVTDDSAVKWRPGARAALELARERATVGLVTNGSRETQRTKLGVLGIEAAFETVVYAGDDTRPKPDPEPFDTALKDLGREPAGALYVGNSYHSDVVGAKRAGLDVCWAPSEHDIDPPDDAEHSPDYTVDSLHDIETVL